MRGEDEPLRIRSPMHFDVGFIFNFFFDICELRIFKTIRSKVLSSESCAAETFQRLIDLWEAIELAALDKPTLCGLAAVVCEALASDCPLLYGSVDFWIFAYKIAKHRESDNRRTEAEMNAFYTSGVNAGGFLPTRALCLLSIAHEILAQAEACANFEVCSVKK